MSCKLQIIEIGNYFWCDVNELFLPLLIKQAMNLETHFSSLQSVHFMYIHFWPFPCVSSLSVSCHLMQDPSSALTLHKEPDHQMGSSVQTQWRLNWVKNFLKKLLPFGSVYIFERITLEMGWENNLNHLFIF